ncbi:hypothetical protein [Tunturiibacter gelidiferens]|uniref:hypothetical protein n=1 Tax=Tunturiibacter gelidiferens TaxID=3069689 RepID=UPI003D9B1B1D
MRQGRRYGLSAAQSIDIWRLWKAGESLHEIGRAFGKLPNDPTFQEVDWHRIWKGEFGMPTTKVKKRKSK